jgi:hypothetical protein
MQLGTTMWARRRQVLQMGGSLLAAYGDCWLQSSFFGAAREPQIRKPRNLRI